MRPIEGQCPVCEKTFLYKVRKQGGGKRPKYCSSRCRSKDWARGNAGKRKAIVLKYDAGHPEERRAATRRRRLQQYGLSEADFTRQLLRQHSMCFGCLNPIDKDTARIDHSHSTGKVRGLLCDHCNWALGHAKDNPATLRRLMAHLDYDREKVNIYLAGSMRNPAVMDIGNRLRADGYDVMDEWITSGEFADESWQAYEKRRGRSYQEALKGRAATNIFLFDRSYIDHSDVVIAVMPAGKSAMLELGYAKGAGIRTYLYLNGVEPERYEVMPQFVDRVLQTEDELLAALRADFQLQKAA